MRFEKGEEGLDGYVLVHIMYQSRRTLAATARLLLSREVQGPFKLVSA